MLWFGSVISKSRRPKKGVEYEPLGMVTKLQEPVVSAEHELGCESELSPLNRNPSTLNLNLWTLRKLNP